MDANLVLPQYRDIRVRTILHDSSHVMRKGGKVHFVAAKVSGTGPDILVEV